MAYIGKQPVVGNFVKLDAITTSATATYNLLNGGVAYSPQSANHCLVSLNGVIQEPTSASNVGGFTISGSTIVFTSALTSSDVIDFILVLGDVLNIGTPSDATVGFAKVTSNLITGATAETSIAGGDSVLIYDDSASALRKMTRTNFVAGIGGTNTPVFYGELASNATITRATITKITGMTTNEVDSNSAFDGTTFTVPSGQGGTYLIIGSITGDYADIGQDGEVTRGFIYKNGSSVKIANWVNSSSTGANGRRITVIPNIILTLSATDTIELYVELVDANGNNAKVIAGETSIAGFKLI